MKDKEKQIEVKKLVNIITKIYPNKYSIEYPARAIRLANELLEHYQPKIDKDSVVLSIDAYNRLKRDSELYEARQKENLKLFAKAYNQGSKETAEKIIKMVFDLFPKDKQFTTISKATVYEIAKQFGVEIKE